MVDYDYGEIKTRQNKDHKVAHIVSKFERFLKTGNNNWIEKYSSNHETNIQINEQSFGKNDEIHARI